MTAKQFFKSTAFKCIVTLLCVLLICGVFLTVMNGLLEVTPEERFNRAINKIYGKTVRTETVAVADYNDNATIDEAYKIKDDGNYLVKATGKGGFDNGTVTCWIVIEVKNGAVDGVGKVIIDSNKAQSYIANINDKFLSAFSENYKGEYFTPYDEGFIRTGATRSATAICNAVNGALDFVNAQLGIVVEDPYENCRYKDYIDTRSTSHTATKESVTFKIKTKGYGNAAEFTITVTVNANGLITAYSIDVNGSTVGYESNMNSSVLDGSMFVGKNLEGVLGILGGDLKYPAGGTDLNTGATQSNFLCLNAAVFATANYQSFIVTDSEEGGNA